MLVSDKLSEHFRTSLDGSYDCIDRMVINPYCSLLSDPRGIRYWWRLLKGDDKSLTTNALMRLAGRFSKRLRAWCNSNKIPLEYFETGERKQGRAKELMPKDKNFEGIFAVFASRAPMKLWEVKRFSNGMDIRRKKKAAPVRHFYFHILDKYWGHITIRMCAHLPFGTQIILNGHEWVARRPAVLRSGVEKQDNCFTSYPDGELLTRHADTLTKKGRLEGVCERWFLKCIWFAIPPKDKQLCPLHFNYSIYQLEFSRNLLFKRGSLLDLVYQGIIDATRSKLDIKRLNTIFGRKRRPYKRKNSKSSSGQTYEVSVETPEYNLTVFKIHCGKLTLKLYDKGERTLRAEVVVHNAKALKCKRSINNFQEIVDKLKILMKDFLDNLLYMNTAIIEDVNLSTLAAPSLNGDIPLAGINIAQPRMQSVLETVLSLSLKINGYAAKDVAYKMQKLGYQYSPRQAAYDIRKLRTKGLVQKHGGRKYKNTEQGLKTIVALLSFINKDFPRTMAILNFNEDIQVQQLNEIELQHLKIKNEINNLRNLYDLQKKAA